MIIKEKKQQEKKLANNHKLCKTYALLENLGKTVILRMNQFLTSTFLNMTLLSTLNSRILGTNINPIFYNTDKNQASKHTFPQKNLPSLG